MEPRLVTPATLREYLGVSPSALARLRKAGTIPGPVRGSRKYDIEAVKRALDNPRAITLEPASDEDELIARAKAWRKSP
jgi:predicted site-specific integrase-resolvase